MHGSDYSKMGSRRKRGKVEKVMHEYKAGALKSGSGAPVTSHKQAVAIALSEAGLSKKRKGRRHG